jgi:putative endonuclease
MEQISPKKQSTREKGATGEDVAVEYLLTKGYTIVTRNYRSRRGEIDCVAKDPDGTLVFVEVKASRNAGCGNPLFRVTPAKQRNLVKMAVQYLGEHSLSSVPCRFDVIAVIGSKIDHLRNAFLR